MSNEDPKPSITPKSALDTLREWKDLLGFVALALTSAFSAVLGRDYSLVQLISWILAGIFVAIAVYFFRRKQKRKRQQERTAKLWAEREAQRKPGSAFRSLAPFEERDKLPGKDRITEARIIATRIASDDFRFGVICGGSGCGKTSLIRAEVVGALKASGFEVAYVRNQRRLEKTSSENLSPADRLSDELATLSKNHIGPNTGVLILDQFEEWFIEYRDGQQRRELGRFLHKSTEQGQQRLKIVAAVRNEFLVDFRDLADELHEPLSANNLFTVKNFSVEQAIDTIKQCAEADGLAPDETFAEMIAHDLAEGGEVRPPELQIVCTSLAASGKLSTSKYRQSGGTAGILAHHIQDAVSLCREPDLGARLLRALCDFPARAKRKPRTLEDLANDVAKDSAADTRLRKAVSEIANQFVVGRILAEEQRQGSKVFTLMHDYLVDAVQVATADASTKTEEANQMLRYYVAEKRGRIPFNKLRFIRAFADRPKLDEPNARRLVRWSLLAPALWSICFVLAAGFLASVFYLSATARIQWNNEIVGRHFAEGQLGSVGVWSLPDGNIATLGPNGEFLRKWNARTGALIATVNQGTRPAMSGGAYLINGVTSSVPNPTLSDQKMTGKSQLINLVTMESTELQSAIVSWAFSAGGNSFCYSDVQTPTTAQSLPVRVLSTQTKTVIHSIEYTPSPEATSIQFKVSDSGDRVLIYESHTASQRKGINLYDALDGKLMTMLGSEEGLNLNEVQLQDDLRLICTMKSLPQGEVVQLWSLDTGKLLRERIITQSSASVLTRPHMVEFSADGSHLIFFEKPDILQDFSPKYEPLPVMVIRTSDLQTAPGIPGKAWLTPFDRAAKAIIWSEKERTRMWDASQNPPQIVEGLHLDDADRFLITPDRKQIIVWRVSTHSVELWDTVKSRLIAVLPHPGPPAGVHLTNNGTAVDVIGEGGLHSLFDVIDGRLIIEKFLPPNASLVSYDPNCRRIHVWNFSGQVLRYTEGRKFFWKFVPSRCKWS